jgi:hypothetical protein
MGTKWRWGLWHVGLALIIGVVVFVTTVLASWIQCSDEAARLSLGTFLHDTSTRDSRKFCMLIAVIAAVQSRSLQVFERDRRAAGLREGILLALAVIVGATLVAFLVTPAHIPSGH